MRTTTILAALLTVLAARSAVAQQASVPHPDSAVSASDEHPPRLSYGTTAGALSWADGHDEEALGAVLQYQPRNWLVLSANPSFAHVTDTTGLSARSGITDLPLAVGVTHAFASAWRPNVGLSGVLSLPVGDAAAGLGSGETALSADAAVGVSPHEGLDLRVGASRGLSSGASSGLGLAGSSVSGEASYDLLERLNANVLYDAELGAADSVYAPARAVGGGLSYALAGPLTLTMEGSHTVAGDGPRWALSLGIGTAFAGVSPVGATSPLARVKGAFSQRLKRSGATSAQCRRRGTC